MPRSFASYLDWSRRMSSSSLEQRHLELKEVAQAVIRPLKSGLHSFNNVLEMLLRVNADIVLPDSQTFRDIRQEIENMKQQMEESEQVARRELQQLDGETEHLTAEQSHLANQKSQRELEIEGLKIQLESNRSSLESYKEALERERDNLKSAENTRDKMIDRRDGGENVRNAGIGITFIPIVGWIAGPIMIAAGESERSMASDAVDSANREIENCESQVSSHSQKVSEYNSLICQAQREIQETDNKIREVEATLRSVAVKREAVSNVQQKIRCAVHQLGKLCGVGNVAELQTQRLILLEPVVKVMEEMTTALGQISGNELLHTEGINSLMWDIKEKQTKLNQLVDTNMSIDDDYY
ncbi:chromosome partition protein Smc [Scophthalmus maximus]|uniref:chromosome partition protein Smc n=1 Tax=Scophthalmus maximus TaxID=52904 RepID=UPI001FA8DA7E|nr:chromosome partition protein Smc [Scophthalmus maximus]